MKVALLEFADTRRFDEDVAIEVFKAGAERMEEGVEISVVPMGESADSDLVRIKAACVDGDVLIIPGFHHAGEVPQSMDPHLSATLERMRCSGCDVVALCTGSFWLASSGLLDGRVATTHWRYCDMLAMRHPAVNVRRNVLYVEQDGVWTSAGMTAGVDTCLAVLRRRYGASVANDAARIMAVSERRGGGWPQMVVGAGKGRRENVVADMRALVRTHPERRWTPSLMADEVGMSVRTLERRFRNECGLTPREWLAGQRIEIACELLERTDLDIRGVALRSGWADPDVFRRHFVKIVGVTPGAYRRYWRGRKGER